MQQRTRLAAGPSYPELRAHVDGIVRNTCIAINDSAIRTRSVMPYKSQFILECVIEELQARV